MPCNRNKSGASIKIADETGSSGERIVTISGNPEAVGMAQFLIKTRYSILVIGYLFVLLSFVYFLVY
jgi:hypothetical protein